jgi:hypothetical protein
MFSCLLAVVSGRHGTDSNRHTWRHEDLRYLRERCATRWRLLKESTKGEVGVL